MKDLPDLILWHDTKERSKTEWLLRGFEELKIPIIKTNKLVNRFKPRSNRLGLYVYPIGFKFGEKTVIAMLDINTIPNMVFPDLLKQTKFYFKTHATEEILRRPNVILFPNSASKIEYLDALEDLRKIKDDTTYFFDFLFVGWHDDDGLRLWTVKQARAQKPRWKVHAGCLPFKHHTKVENKWQLPRMEYKSHLIAQATTKINLALPGGRALPFMSFRHVELMGIGAAVLTRRPTSVPFREELFNHSVIYYDRENFVDIVDHYLKNGEERERIAMNARRYYNKFLTPERHAFCMINAIGKRI